MSKREGANDKEDLMLKTKKRPLKKNVAILVCAAFISASFLGVTHAATRHSPREYYSPYKSFSSYRPVFSLINFNSPLVVIDPAMAYSLSVKDKKPPKKSDQTDPADQTDPTETPDPTTITEQEKEDASSSYNGNGNSGSRKKAKSKD